MMLPGGPCRWQSVGDRHQTFEIRLEDNSTELTVLKFYLFQEGNRQNVMLIKPEKQKVVYKRILRSLFIHRFLFYR